MFRHTLIGLAATAVRERSWQAKLATTIATPFFFFAVSNFGVWLTGINLAGVPYAKTFAGLLECYAAGLPFLRGTMLGDWVNYAETTSNLFAGTNFARAAVSVYAPYKNYLPLVSKTQ